MTTTPDREGWWWGRFPQGGEMRPRRVASDLTVPDGPYTWPVTAFEWGSRIPGPEEEQPASVTHVTHVDSPSFGGMLAGFVAELGHKVSRTALDPDRVLFQVDEMEAVIAERDAARRMYCNLAASEHHGGFMDAHLVCARQWGKDEARRLYTEEMAHSYLTEDLCMDDEEEIAEAIAKWRRALEELSV